MSNAYRAILLAILVAYVMVGASAFGMPGWEHALGGHQRFGLVVAIVGALAHSLPLSYFMGSGYLIKYHAQASGAGPEWKQRHSAWLASRGYPVIYLAGLAIVLTGAAGGLVDTGRLAPHWHAVMALIAFGLGVLEFLWIPPLMRRNRALIRELRARHAVPAWGTESARRLDEQLDAASVRPLYHLSRVLLFAAFNVLGLWTWLRFGTESYRAVPLGPFGSAFVLLLTPGLALSWGQHPHRPRPVRRSWWMALAVGALCGGLLAAL